MAKQLNFLFAFLVLCILQLSILLPATGFTVDLIHRDSPLSPLYNASKTQSDRTRSAFIRSRSRAASLRDAVSQSKQNLQAPAVPTEFENLVKLSVGTPPSPVYAIIDTGSVFSWIQCSPCDRCYKQDYPLFDPNKSSTYKPLVCPSGKCEANRLGAISASCSSNSTSCSYQQLYRDASFSYGEVATETFTFGTTLVPNLTFGCGHNNGGLFKSVETGIIGLGYGEGSFTNQLSGPTNAKFSYCFTKFDPKSNMTGKISFGDDAVVSGPGVVSTPIVRIPEQPIFYRLTLESIKLGNSTIPYRSTTSENATAEKGNIVVDSGFSITLLPIQFFNDLVNEVKLVIKGDVIPDPEGQFSLCYNKTSVNIDGPTITIQFTGAAIEVPLSNAFVEYDEGVLCLGVVPDGNPVFGSLLQVDFLVGYDLGTNMLSFKPTDCSKQ